MFGFLKIKQCGLSDADKALYSAHFCAGCHALAELGGRSASLLTNYDHTLLLIVASALGKDVAPAEGRACTALPVRRIQVQPLPDPVRPVLAALNLAVVEAKLRDDVADEKRTVAQTALRFYSKRNRRAETLLRAAGFPYEQLETLASRQAAVEVATAPTLDGLAEPTASLLETVFGFLSNLLECPEHRDALQRLGRAVGRVIYILDAVTDETDDVRRGRFNALRAAGVDRTSVRRVLLHEVRDFRHAAAALPLGDRAPLVLQVAATLQQRIGAALPGAGSAPQAGRRWFWMWAPRRLQRGVIDTGSCDCCNCCDCGGAAGSGCDCGTACDICACDCCCSSCDDMACDCCLYECCCRQRRRRSAGMGCFSILIVLALLFWFLVMQGSMHHRDERFDTAPRATVTVTATPTETHPRDKHGGHRHESDGQ